MAKPRTSEKRKERYVKCRAGYATKSKLRSVERWPERIAKRTDITSRTIAKHLGKAPPRISEYINFFIEPPEDIFIKIEKYLFDKGV